jgi:hypothetical protein
MRALVSAGHISLAALALLLVVVILTAFSVRKTSGRRISRQPTWGCGYSHAIARVQYTTSSFAQIIADFFGWALQTERKCERPAGILPGNRAACKTHTPDVLLDNLLQPLFVKAGVLVVKIRCLVQNGVIGYYLFYSVLATCLLLILMRF